MEPEVVRRVSPEVCSYADPDHSRLTIEIGIPGVLKENIDLRMHDDSLSLAAPRGDLSYVTTLAFCCPVSAEDAQAKYEEGLLKIEVPFKEQASDVIRIPVN